MDSSSPGETLAPKLALSKNLVWCRLCETITVNLGRHFSSRKLQAWNTQPWQLDLVDNERYDGFDYYRDTGRQTLSIWSISTFSVCLYSDVLNPFLRANRLHSRLDFLFFVFSRKLMINQSKPRTNLKIMIWAGFFFPELAKNSNSSSLQHKSIITVQSQYDSMILQCDKVK